MTKENTPVELNKKASMSSFKDKKKLKTKRSKAKLNKKKSQELTKPELKLQQEMLKIWKNTYNSLVNAVEKAKEAQVYTSSLKAIVSFVLMKNMFLEVRKELEQSTLEELNTNFVVKFVKKARSIGNSLESEDETTGLILVSLRYHLQPYVISGAAWRLAENDIHRAISFLCPKLYSMKNRDFEFIGQEVAYLRTFWRGGAKVTDSDAEKMEKLTKMADVCDESLSAVWKRLYSLINKSNNPFGVNQFVNLLGGLSLNGYWSQDTLIELIHNTMTVEWLDRRFGDAGRLISRLWKRLYSTSKNAINREEEKEKLESGKEGENKNGKALYRRQSGVLYLKNANSDESGEKKVATLPVNEMERKREFLDRLCMTCEINSYKKNEMALYFGLPEFYGAAANIVMVDEDPIMNQFLRYCGPCKKYPIYYAREAYRLTEYHMTKTLDILAWWKEFRNPFIISADKFWELAIETCDLDEEILYENYGNIDDFTNLAGELIKNGSFRSKAELESEEKKFKKVFAQMANGGEEGGLNRMKSTDSFNGHVYNKEKNASGLTKKESNPNFCQDQSLDEGGPSNANGGVYRPPSKRGLYGLTHASIIQKRQSMSEIKSTRSEFEMSSMPSDNEEAASNKMIPLSTEDAKSIIHTNTLLSNGDEAEDETDGTSAADQLFSQKEKKSEIAIPPSPPISTKGADEE